MADSQPSSTGPASTTITAKASIDKFNRGPMTKFWEPAPSCSNTMSYDGNMYYGFGDSGVVDTACYPTGTVKYDQLRQQSAWDLYYYSPAICPGDWERATTFTGGLQNKKEDTTLSLGTGTTAILCCPSGFVYMTQGHICTSTISQNQVVSYVIPKNDDFGTLNIGTAKTSSYATESHAYAAGIVVMFQATDTAMLKSVTVNPSSGATSTAGSTQTSSRTSSSVGVSTASNTSAGAGAGAGATHSAEPASGGLSTGAKVGMGVGIPCALILGLLFGWFLFRRRRAAAATVPPPGYDEAGMVKYAQVHEVHTEPAEMGGNEHFAPTAEKTVASQVHQRHELQ